MLYILDTDHISLLQHNHPLVTTRFKTLSLNQRSTTIVTLEEQVRGWFSALHKTKNQLDAARMYTKLHACITFYTTIHIVSYDERAAKVFENLRSQGLRRIARQDLRIAAIALSQQTILVTRNTRDFGLIPDLALEDWTLPTDDDEL